MSGVWFLQSGRAGKGLVNCYWHPTSTQHAAAMVDPSLINYELTEALLVHSVQQQQGPTALLRVCLACERQPVLSCLSKACKIRK